MIGAKRFISILLFSLCLWGGSARAAALDSDLIQYQAEYENLANAYAYWIYAVSMSLPSYVPQALNDPRLVGDSLNFALNDAAQTIGHRLNSDELAFRYRGDTSALSRAIHGRAQTLFAIHDIDPMSVEEEKREMEFHQGATTLGSVFASAHLRLERDPNRERTGWNSSDRRDLLIARLAFIELQFMEGKERATLNRNLVKKWIRQLAKAPWPGLAGSFIGYELFQASQRVPSEFSSAAMIYAGTAIAGIGLLWTYAQLKEVLDQRRTFRIFLSPSKQFREEAFEAGFKVFNKENTLEQVLHPGMKASLFKASFMKRTTDFIRNAGHLASVECATRWGF